MHDDVVKIKRFDVFHVYNKTPLRPDKGCAIQQLRQGIQRYIGLKVVFFRVDGADLIQHFNIDNIVHRYRDDPLSGLNLQKLRMFVLMPWETAAERLSDCVFRQGLQQIMGRIQGKGFQGVLPACGGKDEPSPACPADITRGLYSVDPPR